MSFENKTMISSCSGTDDDYFKSYGDIEVHKVMLEDHPRNLAYKTAIMNNASYFKDKIVMDVGTGTGFLAVLCAKAGAKKVYAVEASSDLTSYAQCVMQENNCTDIVEIMNCKVEEAQLPAGVLVDIIVSEWMGFYLLHEAMLESVFYARDHFLKPDGHLFPESATIYAAPCRLPSFFDYWTNVDGVSMEAVGIMLRANRSYKPEIMCVGAEDLIAREEAVCFINLKEDKSEDLEEFTLKHVFVSYNDCACHGICIWFDCTFPELTDGLESPVTLSTSPFSPPTHWKQTVFVFSDEMKMDKGEPMAFEVELSRSTENRRRYTLTMVYLDPEEIEHPTPCLCIRTKCIIINKFMQEHPAIPADQPGENQRAIEELDPEHYSGSDSDD